MKEPVDHILRPQLPWRTVPGITECGFDASKVKTLTRDDFFRRYKDLGLQRTAMVTCMTCLTTAERWGTWEDDPRKALEREIHWECARSRGERGLLLRDELVAVAALIQTHSDEFRQLVETETRRREWLGQKDALARKSRRCSE